MSNLSKSQQELADLLINTKTHAKVRRRKIGADGKVEFYYLIRDTSPVDFRESEEEFAFVYHENNPTAPLSPILVNLRKMPDSLNLKIAECMAQIKLKNESTHDLTVGVSSLDRTSSDSGKPTTSQSGLYQDKPDFCTGIPNAAIPYAKDYSKVTGIPYLTLFEKDDKPGSPRILPAEGAMRGKGKTLLIIDDVITKGESKFRAFKVAEELGYKVLGLVVLVDRGEGGRQMIQDAGYKFYAPLNLQDLLDYYLEKGKIDQKLYDETVKYLKQSASSS